LFVLWNKELTILTYPFLLLPIFNSPNHTGEKRSFLTYIFTTLILIFILRNKFEIIDVVPLFFILIIELFEKIRTRLLRFSSSLYNEIDNFYLKKLNLKKSHLIYAEIIERLNNSRFKFFFTTKIIMCFKLKNSKFSIMNSSIFAWNYSIKIDSEKIKELENERLLSNLPIEINFKTYSVNFYIPIKVENEMYVFVYIVEDLKIWSICKFYVSWYLKPLLSKIAVVLRVEKELRDDRDNYIKKMKDKMYYVNNATLAMHFLRNKFSPIKNYLEMIEKEERFGKEKKDQYSEILKKELSRVKTSVKEILDRTNLILEKSENPFIVNQLSEVSLKKVVDICRKIWYDFFDHDSIIFQWKDIDETKKSYNLNEDGLEILITDITENLHKYQDGIFKLRFTEDNDSYFVTFENNVKNYDSLNIDLEKMALDFMSDDNIEINKRTTHGMSMIKSFLNQMKIEYKLSIENRIFLFKLIFNK